MVAATKIRPVYDYVSRRRSLRGWLWGVFVNGELIAVTIRYPSHLV